MLLEVGIIPKKRRRKKEKKRNQNCIQVWAIPIPISTTKDVICCSNGYIYQFLDYMKLLLNNNNNNDNNNNNLSQVEGNQYCKEGQGKYVNMQPAQETLPPPPLRKGVLEPLTSVY